MDAFLNVLSSGSFSPPVLLKLQALHPLENILDSLPRNAQASKRGTPWPDLALQPPLDLYPSGLAALIPPSADSVPGSCRRALGGGEAGSWIKADDAGCGEKLC